jgi:hypothetical protein
MHLMQRTHKTGSLAILNCTSKGTKNLQKMSHGVIHGTIPEHAPSNLEPVIPREHANELQILLRCDDIVKRR